MQIACPEADRALFDELHGLYQSGARETLSLLFLDKTTRAFEINSGSYTAWVIRRRCLLANPLYLDLNELKFVREQVYATLKNYQVWFHRRWVCEHLADQLAKNYDHNRHPKPDKKNSQNEEKEEEEEGGGGGGGGSLRGEEQTSSPSSSSFLMKKRCRSDLLDLFDDEKDDLMQVLWKDPKNMAAWAYRAWLSRTKKKKMAAFCADCLNFCCCDFEEDLECTGRFIEDDPYNNSAWASRVTEIKQFLTHQAEMHTTMKKKKKTFSSLSSSSLSSPPATASLGLARNLKQQQQQPEEEEEEERNGGYDWRCRDEEGEKVEERRSTHAKIWKREVT